MLPERFHGLRLWSAFEHSDELGAGVAVLLSEFDEFGDLGEDGTAFGRADDANAVALGSSSRPSSRNRRTALSTVFV